MGPAHTENVVELACRTAMTYRGVAHITMPVDFQSATVSSDTRSARNIKHHVSTAIGEGAHAASEGHLAAAAAILNSGNRIAILAGRGAIGCERELEATAERLGAPVIKPLLGKGSLSDLSPYSTGGIGLLGTAPSQEAMETCDTLLIVGSSFPYIEYYPKPGNARAIQIEIDPKRIGLRYPVEAPLVGDACQILRDLLPRLDYHVDRSFLIKAQDGMAKWRDLLEERGTRTDMPMKPQVVAHELDKLLADDAIISAPEISQPWPADCLTQMPQL